MLCPNHSQFGTKLDEELARKIRCLTIPSFTKNNEIVFMDLETLEVYPYQFNFEEDEKDVSMDD